MNKSELRKKYKALRQNLSQEQIENLSIEIANQLLRMDIWQKTYYHLFLTIESQKEVQTEFILNVLFAKNKEVVVSKSNFEDNSLSNYLLTENTQLKVSNYGIPEPQNGLPVPEEMIDVVFIPLLAFDKQGNRVGYGKGFYDSFLAKCKPDTIKIGLSFFEAISKIEGVFEGDIPLDYCVTPSEVYHFENNL